MKNSVFIVALLGLLIASCQSEITCDQKLLGAIDQHNIYADSTTAVLSECGQLDKVDLEILTTPLLSDVVKLDDFNNAKYDLKRFVTEFKTFSKTDKYASLRSMMILKTKKYVAEDWAEDKKSLIRQYSLSDADAELLETVAKDPANAALAFPELFKKMNDVKVQKLIEEAKARQQANQ